MNAALAKCFPTCPGDGAVLDVGCLGFKQMQNALGLGLCGLRHHGVDFAEPEDGVPDGFVFRQLPPQPVDATQALNLSAGVSNPKVLRGRSLS